MRRAITLLLAVCLTAVLISHTFADGRQLAVPKKLYESRDIVGDTYRLLQELNMQYPGLTQLEVIGSSVEGRDIIGFRVGTGHKELMINAAHHGKEFMTSILVVNQIEYLLQCYQSDAKVEGMKVREVLDETSVYFVPFVNPDGVSIAKYGLDGALNREAFMRILPKNKTIFTDWKANARGVDPNRNYDTDLRYITDAVSSPGARNYPGPAPFSEPETQAIKLLCEQHEFEMAVAYHSAGEIIYWYYNQWTAAHEKRDLSIANLIKKVTGYGVVPKTKNPSGGGMKDWFVAAYGKPGFTIEIGKEIGEYKILKYEEYQRIWDKNKNIPIHLANEVNKLLNPKKPNYDDPKDTEHKALHGDSYQQ